MIEENALSCKHQGKPNNKFNRENNKFNHENAIFLLSVLVTYPPITSLLQYDF